MLTPEEQKKVDKKLSELLDAQEVEKKEMIQKRHLDKPGDANWTKYVKKQLALMDAHFVKEYKATRVMYTRELINRRNGKKASSQIDI